MINYISKQLVNEILVSYMCGYDGENYDIISALRDISAKINEAPSADVQPVKRGRWIEIDYGMFYECSECGNVREFERNFCSNCGADMREANATKG